MPKPHSPGSVERTALVELFATVECIHCPEAINSLAKLKKEIGDSNLVILAYHPLKNDPFGSAETEARKEFYGIRGFPTVVFDGYKKIEGIRGDPYIDYKREVEDRLSQKSPIKLETRFSIRGDTLVAYNTLMVEDSLTQSASGGLTLFTLIFEDSILYKAPNGETLQHFVVRDILPDAKGEELSLRMGDTLTRSYNTLIPSGWNKSHLGVVVFLQTQENKEVLQSAEGNQTLPGYDFTLTVPETLQTVKVNSEAIFNFIIENTGSLGDSLMINIQSDTLPEDWFFSLCSGSLCYPIPCTEWVEPGSSISFLHISVTPQSKGKGSIILLVKSISDTTLSYSQRLTTIAE